VEREASTGRQTEAQAVAGAVAEADATGGLGEDVRVQRRLRRIEGLGAAGAPSSQLLGELRELVSEAEALSRIESERRSSATAAEVHGEGEGMR
jgi:hypothetical protein